MSDCFLIADEVGLGKTKSAKAVLFEMVRMKRNHDVHAIYIASSSELAAQNMKAEFLSDTIGSQEHNYSGLAGFQAANAGKTLKVFWGDGSYSSNDASEYAGPDRIRQITGGITRMSDFRPEMCEPNKPYIISLSPRTSFFVPSQLSLSLNSYKGSREERTALVQCFEDLLACYEKKDDVTVRPLIKELEKAILISGEEDVPGLCRNIKKNVNEDPQETDADWFYMARNLRNDASAALYKPDLIILDEFQRFRTVLGGGDNIPGAYSVRRMIDYLRSRFKDEDPEYSPKILLLSATPYNYDRDLMEPVQWRYGSGADADPFDKQDSYSAATGESRGAYRDLQSLAVELKGLGAKSMGSDLGDFMARTERTMFDGTAGKNGAVCISGAGMEQQRSYQNGYLNPAIRHCYEKDFDDRDFQTISSEISENPEFWRFNYGYTKRTILSSKTQAELLQNGIGGAYSVFDDLGLLQLEKEIFDPATGLPRLWVPPVSSGETNCGKTLVFTTMQVTTRAVAYFADRMAQNRVKDYTAYDEADIKAQNLSTLDIPSEIAGEVLAAFFNRRFVKRVIAAYMDRTGNDRLPYIDAVSVYCRDYRFAEMINEYETVLGSSCSSDRLLMAFMHLPSSVIEYRADPSGIKKTYSDIDYSEMFICDDNKAGRGNSGEDDGTDISDEPSAPHRVSESLEDICDHFNSPVYPMVLVARNTGQEGFNLQYYGDKLMHWQVASTVNGFLQREGRLNRPGSLVFRQKVWKWAADHAEGNAPKSYGEAKSFFDHRIGKYRSETETVTEDAYKSGIWPLWNFEYGDIRVRQILPIYEYGDTFDEFVREIVAADRYSGFCENVRQLCPFLMYNNSL